jgi:hypothetical protein
MLDTADLQESRDLFLVPSQRSAGLYRPRL